MTISLTFIVNLHHVILYSYIILLYLSRLPHLDLIWKPIIWVDRNRDLFLKNGMYIMYKLPFILPYIYIYASTLKNVFVFYNFYLRAIFSYFSFFELDTSYQFLSFDVILTRTTFLALIVAWLRPSDSNWYLPIFERHVL